MNVEPAVGTALVKASEIVGADIVDSSAHKMASIKELFLHPASGQIQFVIVEVAALLGTGGKFHPIPWSLLQWDAGRPAYVAPFDKDRLKAGPSYDRDQLNSAAYGWDAQVRTYYAG